MPEKRDYTLSCQSDVLVNITLQQKYLCIPNKLDYRSGAITHTLNVKFSLEIL